MSSGHRTGRRTPHGVLRAGGPGCRPTTVRPTASATRRRHRTGSADGYTLLEVLLVVALMMVVVGIGIAMMPGALTNARADSGQSQLASLLRTAREQAISERRNIDLRVLGNDQVQIAREEQPGPAFTILTTVTLEGRMQFLLFPGFPDTPDAFGNAAPVDFGATARMTFTSEGTFVDAAGDPLNGTIFLGVPNERLTGRAVTIFGPTALIREWRWDGARWVE